MKRFGEEKFVLSIELIEAWLRTLALASLQAGLQNNQGLPIADVAKWLAMEVPSFALMRNPFCILSRKRNFSTSLMLTLR
ncbi:hypothetical protein M0R45_001259 [Rubus argutus]|uniref:Uncharacterized protein n=1 Tax=Rubus argutus TaxID=59490 RepID=A0AAW1VMQ5_RUBAR